MPSVGIVCRSQLEEFLANVNERRRLQYVHTVIVQNIIRKILT